MTAAAASLSCLAGPALAPAAVTPEEGTYTVKMTDERKRYRKPTTTVVDRSGRRIRSIVMGEADVGACPFNIEMAGTELARNLRIDRRGRFRRSDSLATVSGAPSVEFRLQGRFGSARRATGTIDFKVEGIGRCTVKLILTRKR